MLDTLKEAVSGTAVEPWLRGAWAWCSGHPGLRYDVQTLEVMRRTLKPASNCVDVGCHRGRILKVMLRHAPAGRHHAFEPLPELHARLAARYAHRPQVSLHCSALSDRTGEAAFQHVLSNSGYSGFRRRRYDRPQETVREIVVRRERLDDVLPPGLAVHFIKIDVEGAELEVLRGARQTLLSSRPLIVFEHGLGAADCYGTRPEDIFDLLSADCGLRLMLMATWLRDPDAAGYTRQEFSAQFTSGANHYFLATAG